MDKRLAMYKEFESDIRSIFEGGYRLAMVKRKRLDCVQYEYQNIRNKKKISINKDESSYKIIRNGEIIKEVTL